MQKAMKNTSAMILAGSLMVGGLLACTDESPVQEGNPQAEAEQQPSMTEETQSYTDTGSTMSQEAISAEPTDMERPVMDDSMSPSERAFTALDANSDSMLDENEVTVNATIHQDFEAIDLDQNGLVSLNEFMVYAGDATAAGAETPDPAADAAVPTE
ncbi:hypothetical protein BTA51_19505 [Hahella sp. CCB-MM4]|nr:hypothetical protein BTA51_19505 [Hahella sp. CCB-MM4]